jgi:tetratricopeptide (TPR) repeat protein
MRPQLPGAVPLLISLACVLSFAGTQNDAVSEAVEAIEHGDLSHAEHTLREKLRVQPNDDQALGVLAMVLDQENKYTEADQVYRRALSLSPRSAGLLNNYGNHLLATGKVNDARAAFIQVLALKPGHVNATTQLARLALERKAPAEALKYLDRLPANPAEDPEVSIVRMQADYAAGRNADGDVLLARLSRAAEINPHLDFALGVALSGAGKYDKAEGFFESAVKAAPTDFQALYDLGLAASHAGHEERAREILQKALELQPENVDAMYDLAAVNAKLDHKETALELLARAARIAPQRAEVILLLAHTSADLGYFGDAAEAWEKYMKLKPADATARREHAFAQTALGENMQAGLADLASYVRKHPNDSIGHYELGVAESPTNKEDALRELNRALALDPALAAAHLARGLLRYRQGNAQLALADFEFAAAHAPNSATILDRLGQTYLALNRTSDALRVLHQAAELAPRDSTILFHYARALSKAGEQQQASAIFARYRELGPGKSASPHPAGLIDFLSLSPEEQRARYRAGVERTVEKNPANAEAQVRYMELALEDGKMDEAIATSRKIVALNPSAPLIGEAARALLAAEQYGAAKQFVEQCAHANVSGELALDLAIADSHLVNAQAGLEQMNRIPQSDRNGDYYLALAAMLDAAGRLTESNAALKQALESHPTRPDLYRQAASRFIQNHRTQDALQVLDAATRAVPDDADLSLMKDALEASLR